MSSSSNEDKRKSPRIALILPVVITWSRKDGLRVMEHAETADVSAQGALLRSTTQLSRAVEVTLIRPGTGQSRKGRVARSRQDETGQSFQVGIELVMPDDNFWET